VNWDRPKRPAQWLLLLTPAALSIVPTMIGGIFDGKGGDWIGWAIMGLLAASLLSFILSIWLARVSPTVGGKLGAAVLIFIILMVVNGTLSFAGCAVGSSAFPRMDFR
jgi:hypothetical protein